MDLLFILPFRVLSIFSGFTFTDWEDFLPLLTLVIGLTGVLGIRYVAQAKVSRSTFILLSVLSLWPLLPNLGIFFMAREFQAIEGHWPKVMIDDPKNVYNHVSPTYNGLFHATNYLEAFSGAWMIIFFTLFFSNYSRLSSNQRRLCGILTLISLCITIFDPGNLYTWWID